MPQKKTNELKKSNRALFSMTCVGVLVLLSACGGHGYRSPTVSGNISKMSSQTLCYRAAYAKSNEAYADEIALRRLDCDAMLADDPLAKDSYGGGY